MKIIDLTLPIEKRSGVEDVLRTEELRIVNRSGAYTGIVHQFRHNSMVGTYIDFPSHIKETDDGSDAANYPPDRLLRVKATVIHLDRQDGSGRVSAAELAAGLRASLRPAQKRTGGALILNALGRKRFDKIAFRSVYLGRDAVRWIVGQGFHLVIADIYESDSSPQNVFPALFRAGIAAVCQPINLHCLIGTEFFVTVLFPRFKGATQAPCRVLVEIGEA